VIRTGHSYDPYSPLCTAVGVWQNRLLFAQSWPIWVACANGTAAAARSFIAASPGDIDIRAIA
jgi:hypothetical protein